MLRDGRNPFYDLALRTGPLLQSGIALAGANLLSTGGYIGEYAEDGILVAAEAALLDLEGTELVVLSACETGLGVIESARGVAGLRSAFLHAGAQNVIMSLWMVPGEQTSRLMQSFYSNYLNGVAPAEALRLAQLSVRLKLRSRGQLEHPFYWAGFVLETRQFD